MPEITVISGKGGTGKTTVTGALAHLANDAVICDLDVHARNIHHTHCTAFVRSDVEIVEHLLGEELADVRRKEASR